MGCGSTIGPITAAKTGIKSIDIGIPQLSMHSIRETCATRDLYTNCQLLTGQLTYLNWMLTSCLAFFTDIRVVEAALEEDENVARQAQLDEIIQRFDSKGRHTAFPSHIQNDFAKTRKYKQSQGKRIVYAI